MLSLFKKILRELGFMLIANSAFFMPLIASADNSGDGTMGTVIFAPIGGIVTGSILVSMSRTKHKATKADKYIDGKLDLHDKRDNYLRTSTSKTKIRD